MSYSVTDLSTLSEQIPFILINKQMMKVILVNYLLHYAPIGLFDPYPASAELTTYRCL